MSDTNKTNNASDGGLHPMTCSVIFLDFDGVIRVTLDGGWLGPDSSEFCQLRMKVLREVCQKTGSRIVVSSDWRNIGNRTEIEGHLSPYLADQLHDDWATPITGHRWNEVAAWLREHPEVTSYAILEDFAPHFEGCPPEMEKRLMLCTNRHGLVPAITERLLCILPQNVKSVARRKEDSQSEANERRYPPLPPLSCSAVFLAYAALATECHRRM